MKTKRLLLVLSCLLLLTGRGYVQPADSPWNDFKRMLESPVMQEYSKRGTKITFRSFWEGRGSNMIVFDLLQDSEIRDAWNVSDAQLQQLMNAQKSPKLQELMMELHTIQTPDDPFFDNSDAETQGKFLDLLERMQLLYMEDVAYLIDNTLTGEQKQKVGEALLASMGEIPLVSPNMFEALTLTDDQRQQMERIKEALEPEFEKNLETFANASRVMSNKFLEELERQGIENPQDFEEKMRAIAKKLRAEDAEFNKIFEESLSLGRAFATQLKVEMFDVLTDAQWMRLQGLIDNPPRHTRLFIAKLREQMGESESRGGGWQPGPGSWRPGDPIPEAYRLERIQRGNFPRPANP